MRIGIDLGGTKIEGIVLDSAGTEVRRRRVPTPASSYVAIVRAIGDLVRGLEAELGVQGASVGVGTPGALSPATGRLRNSNTVCMQDQPMDVDLERELNRPVRLANDANCFALSEATDGAAAGAGVVFGVILGTGTGGGVVVHGRVLTGANAVAGEWGHNPLPWPDDGERPGPPCYCGKSGCIESFLSGPGFSHDHLGATGETLSAIEIVSRGVAGDAAAKASLLRYEGRLARALASIINVLDPDVVVLGGGLSNIDRLLETVPALWSQHVFSDVVRTRLVKARHGDSSGVRGAAWLWDVPETPRKDQR